MSSESASHCGILVAAIALLGGCLDRSLDGAGNDDAGASSVSSSQGSTSGSSECVPGGVEIELPDEAGAFDPAHWDGTEHSRRVDEFAAGLCNLELCGDQPSPYGPLWDDADASDASPARCMANAWDHCGPAHARGQSVGQSSTTLIDVFVAPNDDGSCGLFSFETLVWSDGYGETAITICGDAELRETETYIQLEPGPSSCEGG